MICKHCNKEVPENSQFCTNCGNKLNIQENNNLNNAGENKEESANVGLAILSWFIPLAGLIIFLVKKHTHPKTAKVSGICALISFSITMIFTITVVLFTTTTISSIINEAKENSAEINDYYDDYDYDYNYDYDYDYDTDDNTSNEDTTNTEETNDTESSTNWKEYKFTVNNTELSLPTTYEKLNTTTGFSIKSAEAKSYLSGNYYTIANMYKNDKLALYIELTNNTKEDLKYTECQVTRVSQTKYQVSQGADAITFPGGLKAGEKITEDKITELFGTPYDTNEYSSEGYESKTYKYVEDETWTTTNNYEIKVVNGVIDELSLDNRN